MEHAADRQAVVIAVHADCPDAMPALAMTYSPLQVWDTILDAETGLKCGTIFPCLNKPFLEGACPRV